MSRIIKSGYVFPLDSSGFVINGTSIDRVQSHWAEVLDWVTSYLWAKLTEPPRALFVRGSVALGRAIDGRSDLDLFLLSQQQLCADANGLENELNLKVTARFPFVTQVDLNLVSRRQLRVNTTVRMGLKTQSLCWFGEDVTAAIDPFKPGIDMVVHALQLATNLARVRAFLDEEVDPRKQAEVLPWIAKIVLRSGFELVMERAGCYTRDLYPCYQNFSRFYPQWEAWMRRFLEVAILADSPREDVLKWLDELAPWLCEEIHTELGLALLIARSRGG